MARLSGKQYEQRMLGAMAAYTAFMLAGWPLVRTTGSLPLKLMLALAPLLPMFYVLALMARRIRESDELEQRTHLVALGVATGVTAALSLAGGFLSIAGLVPLDGSVLIWIFPLMMVCYGTTRWQVGRRYGVDVGCDEHDRPGRQVRFLLMGVILAVCAAYAWLRHWDDFKVGLLCGLALSFLVVAALMGLRRRAAEFPDE